AAGSARERRPSVRPSLPPRRSSDLAPAPAPAPTPAATPAPAAIAPARPSVRPSLAEVFRDLGTPSTQVAPAEGAVDITRLVPARDRKSTRLNSSHVKIPYAVFCLKN